MASKSKKVISKKMFENGGGEGGVEVWFGHFRTQT
jgi:hypothetical protein